MGGFRIADSRQAEYRLRLARGFLDEARQDEELERWRSVVDGSQLAVENAAKAGLMLSGKLRRLAELSELLGSDIHIQTDYGDEAEGRTPWELFTEGDARQTLAYAEEAVSISEALIRES